MGVVDIKIKNGQVALVFRLRYARRNNIYREHESLYIHPIDC